MHVRKSLMVFGVWSSLAGLGCGSPVAETGGTTTGTTSSTASSASSTTGAGATNTTGSGPHETGSSNTGASSTSTTAGTSGASTTGGAATDLCTGAAHVAVGDSVSASTCPGSAGAGGDPCENGNPEVDVVVDDPDGGAFQLSVTAGYSIIGYLNCDSTSPSQCQFGGAGAGPFSPAAGLRIFGIQRTDAACGDFTLSVSAL